MKGMNTSKTGISSLVEICAQKGVNHIVFSPGSRCAPLVFAFNRHTGIKTYTIVDERSAAFFALGMAQCLRKPVGLVCTSGTAVLNYAPAIAEAKYQKLPLLVLTADRPVEWIDQGDMQTIRQTNIFGNYINKSFELPQQIQNKDNQWHNDRIVSEAINLAVFPEMGPVHINIPLNEPLYDLKPFKKAAPKIISVVETENIISKKAVQDLKNVWADSKRKWILVGLHPPDKQLKKYLEKIAMQSGVTIWSETSSNLQSPLFVSCIDRNIDTLTKKELVSQKPDLVLSIGGYIVSKKMKTFLRNNPPTEHWHINRSGEHWDTYQSLTKVIPCHSKIFIKQLVNFKVKKKLSNYFISRDKKIEKAQVKFLKEIPFSDLKVYRDLFKHIPEKSLLQMGNSTPIRYSNLFSHNEKRDFYCNRGVGGIDGCLSTAAGFAAMTKKPVTLILGDLSLAYDSNGLWNNYLNPNLRIIVINNDGGNIFRIIKGPDSVPEVNQYFETKNEISFDKLAETYNLSYHFCETENGLNEILPDFFKYNSKRPKILEIKTDGVLSAQIMRKYFEFLKKNI